MRNVARNDQEAPCCRRGFLIFENDCGRDK